MTIVATLFEKARSFADVATNPPDSSRIDNSVAQTTSNASRVSHIVDELMETRKNMLNQLWEDTDTSWVHREAFSYSNFNTRAHENFSDISHETMRLFEVKWLDNRINGLIEQRESSLDAMQRISEGQCSSDTMKQKLLDQLLIFRSTTLYLTEYIQTWMEKISEKPGFSWKENDDYLFKMSFDFQNLFSHSDALFKILSEMGINTESPLLPPLEMDEFEKSKIMDKDGRPIRRTDALTKRNTDQFGYVRKVTTTGMTELSQDQDVYCESDREELPVFITEERLENRKEIIRQQKLLLTKAGKSSSEFATVDEMMKTSDADTLRFSSNVVVIGSQSQKQMSSASTGKRSSDRTSNGSIAPMSVSTLQQEHRNTVQKPLLLVDQLYSDKNRKFKKYSYPLVSVRHEDLLEQSNLDSRRDLFREQVSTDFGDRLRKIQDLGLKFSNEVLSQHTASSLTRVKKLPRTRPHVLEKSVREVDKAGTRNQRKHIEIDKQGNIVFPGPDLQQEIRRIRSAEAIIKAHVAKH